MNESQKLNLRRFLIITFLNGSILFGIVLISGSVYVSVEIFLTYKEHGIFGYAIIPIIVFGPAIGFLIPWFVAPLSRIALNLIKKKTKS